MDALKEKAFAMTLTERASLSLIVQHGPITCSGLGERLWDRKPDGRGCSLARPAGRLVASLVDAGFVKVGGSVGRRHFSLYVATQDGEEANRMNLDGMKRCPACLKVKTIEEFGKNASCKDGAGAQCLACHNDRVKLDYKVNPDPVRKRVRAWQSAHPEKVVEYGKRSKTLHPDGARDRSRRRRLDPVYREEHRLINSSGRAKRRGAEGSGVTVEQWCEILETFGHACAYCLRTDRKLTVDHVISLHAGGLHDVENVVPACRSCNSRKCARRVLCMVNEPLLADAA